jgi:hypothetical protein
MNAIVQSEDRPATAVVEFAARQMGLGANHGAVAIEQERAIAEVQGQIIIAQRCPRDVVAATAEFLEACKMPEFAEKAFYSVPNRGSGPSIRFAEEAARCYGNFQFGHRELGRGESRGNEFGKSEIEVYAWDVQKNNRSTRQITVMHTRDKKINNVMTAVPLTDQTDIDNRIANVASKQMRGRILALLPKAMVAAGEAMAKKTLAGNNDRPLSARIIDMTTAFADTFSVTAPMLETYVGHKLDTVNIDEFADLRGVFNALREGAKVSEYFNADGEVKDDGATGGQNDKLDGAAKKGAAEKAKRAAAAEAEKAEKAEAAKKDEPKKDDAPKEEAKAETKAEPEKQSKATEEPDTPKEPKPDPKPEPKTETEPAPKTETEQRQPGDDDAGDDDRFAPPADESSSDGPRPSIF